MRRRDFITLITGAAAAWPQIGGAQQPNQARRIGVLMNGSAADAHGQDRLAAFTQALRKLGWVDGDKAQIDERWSADVDTLRKYASELVGFAPDVILAHGSAATGFLLQLTRTLPIVFVWVADPVGAGYVESLSRPGGNATGWVLFEYSLSAKWLELLKEVAPNVKRVAVLRDPNISAGLGQFAALQSIAPSAGVEVTPVNVRVAKEIERSISEFADSPNSSLILTASALAQVHRHLIIKLAALHKLPAIYYERVFAADGGLISYGPDGLKNSAGRRVMSIAFSGGRSLPICQCRHRPSTSWSSI